MPGVGVEGGVRGGDLHAAALPGLQRGLGPGLLHHGPQDVPGSHRGLCPAP